MRYAKEHIWSSGVQVAVKLGLLEQMIGASAKWLRWRMGQRLRTECTRTYGSIVSKVSIEMRATFPDEFANAIALREAEDIARRCVPDEVTAALVDAPAREELPSGAALMVGAHFGNLFFIARTLRAYGVNARFVVRCPTEPEPTGSARWPWADESRSDAVIPVGGAFGRCKEHLNSGGVVCIMGDGRIRADTSAVVLGRQWTLPSGPYALSQQCSVPIILTALRRGDRRRYQLVLEPMETCRDAPHYAQVYADWLSSAIAARPHEWRETHWESFLTESRAIGGLRRPD